MLFLIPAAIFLILWLTEKKKHAKTQAELQTLQDQLQILGEDFDSFRLKFAKVSHAEAEAERIRKDADEILFRAKIMADDCVAQANSTSVNILSKAKEEARRIRNDALQSEGNRNKNKKSAQLDLEKIISELNADTTTIPEGSSAPNSVTLPEGIITVPKHTPLDSCDQ